MRGKDGKAVDSELKLPMNVKKDSSKHIFSQINIEKPFNFSLYFNTNWSFNVIDLGYV